MLDLIESGGAREWDQIDESAAREGAALTRLARRCGRALADLLLTPAQAQRSVGAARMSPHREAEAFHKLFRSSPVVVAPTRIQATRAERARRVGRREVLKRRRVGRREVLKRQREFGATLHGLSRDEVRARFKELEITKQGDPPVATLTGASCRYHRSPASVSTSASS